jgi:hypothetical protein
MPPLARRKTRVNALMARASTSFVPQAKTWMAPELGCPSSALLKCRSRVNPTCGDKPGQDVQHAWKRARAHTNSGQGTMVDFTVFIAIASFTARDTPASSNG